jgi:hypothetical protein
MGDWMGPIAGLDAVEKGKFLILPGPELRLFGRPANSQSLYRLSYPTSHIYKAKIYVASEPLWRRVQIPPP